VELGTSSNVYNYFLINRPASIKGIGDVRRITYSQTRNTRQQLCNSTKYGHQKVTEREEDQKQYGIKQSMNL